jgi:cation diffusion facilitator CzcD-associated flavoprotein CzcO
MTTASVTAAGDTQSPDTGSFDVVVVGAGFSGLYALHKLSGLGLGVVCFEAGDGVGGTWYWNRYPGARVDIESMQYSYGFDEDLQQDWKWPEYFSPQADLEAYANHVADRFGLRAMIRFGARVNRMDWDPAASRWQVATERGDAVSAKYVVAASGALNATNLPPFPGLEKFRGEWYHTAQWPKDEVSFAGKRVGLIGTGSTGIQLTPVIAESAGHLHVFQRTPAYTVPARNRALPDDYEREWKDSYAERRTRMRNSPGAALMPPPHQSIFDFTPEQQQEILEKAWNARNGLIFVRTFADTMVSLEANEIVAEFIRGKIRQIVRDPEVAERLTPRTYPVGTKRICMDTGYYETFNQENVTLVDVRANPITEITETGLRTTAGDYELDMIVFATGFDAVTGSLKRMNITGTAGLSLSDQWRDRPTNYLGFQVSGFPNLFMIHGPGSPGVLTQMITTSEWQVEWIAGVIEDLNRRDIASIETTPEAEEGWDAEMEAMFAHTLYRYADSWYVGANIEGKPRKFLIYIGGFDNYVRRCTEAVSAGYRGFTLTPADQLASPGATAEADPAAGPE